MMSRGLVLEFLGLKEPCVWTKKSEIHSSAPDSNPHIGRARMPTQTTMSCCFWRHCLGNWAHWRTDALCPAAGALSIASRKRKERKQERKELLGFELPTPNPSIDHQVVVMMGSRLSNPRMEWAEDRKSKPCLRILASNSQSATLARMQWCYLTLHDKRRAIAAGNWWRQNCLLAAIGHPWAHIRSASLQITPARSLQLPTRINAQ